MSERIMMPSPLSVAQARAAAAFEGTRGCAPFGPFVPLLSAPRLLPLVEALGRGVRYEGCLPDDVREVAILTTAHLWSQPIEWNIHAPVALAAGVTQATLDAICADSELVAPDGQRAAHRIARALHLTRDLDDDGFALGEAAFGSEGLIELVVLCGYYALLAMVMNTARTAH